MLACQFSHGCEIGLGFFNCHWACVFRNVVGPGENDDDLGCEGDYVLTEANKHLRCCLAADTAVDIPLVWEICIELPSVRNRVAEEDNAILVLCSRTQLRIGRTIAVEF